MCTLDFNPVSCPFPLWFQSSFLSVCQIDLNPLIYSSSGLISVHLFVHLPHMIQSDSQVTIAQNDIGEEIKQKAAG